MTDSDKLRLLASWLSSAKEGEILTRLDHFLTSIEGRETVIRDLRRMSEIMKWLHEEESPISPGDSMYDYCMEDKQMQNYIESVKIKAT